MPSLPADFEETQPLDSPQSDDGGWLMDRHLFGQTQALDDPDFDNLGICDWGKTQLIDDGDQDDGGTEKTVVLSDGEGLLDDGASRCGGETKLGVDDMGSEKKESPVDSDASTDDEGCKGIHVSSSSPLAGASCKSNGPVRRNFTSVRAASLRASALAARSATPKTTGSNPNSCSSDRESIKMQEDLVSGPSCKRVLEFNSSRKAAADLVSSDVKTVEERDEPKGRSDDNSIMKYFNEVTPEEEQMIGGNLHAGLTYVHSQEPGSQSQANALDVVDNFLLINEIGLSQDVNTENAHKVQLTPISCTKGTRSLAQKVDLRSPVGKIGIFEWVDSLEDEGGGDFFRRKKDLFFEKKDKPKKSQSVPAKAQHLCLGTTEDAMQMVVEKKDSIHGNNLKTRNFASDSKLILNDCLINDKALVSIKAKKKLDKYLDELSSPKHLGQQLEATGGGEDAAMNAVGPDTQMAAETMEALGQNSLIIGSKNDALPLFGIAEKPNHYTVIEVPPRRVLRQRRASENVGMGSECKRTPLKPHSKVIRGVHNLSRERQSNTGSLANGNESSASLNVDEQNQALAGTFTKNTEQCENPLTLDDQPQVCEELKDHLDLTPVACRTRHFKMSGQRKQFRRFCSAEKNTNRLFDRDASRALKIIDNPVVNGPGSMIQDFTSHCNRLDVNKLHEEDSSIRSPAKDAFHHPKRRRTCHNISGSSALKDNPSLSNQSALVIDMLATTANPPTGQRKRIFIKSVCGIRDLAIQKKRTAFLHKKSYFDTTPPNTVKSSKVSGVKTRSSMNSSLFKHHPKKKVGGCPREPIFDEAGLADAVHDDSIAATSDRANNTEATLGMQDEVSICHTKDGGECSKSVHTPKGKVPLSAMNCSTLKDADAVSPVCMAQDPPRISSKKRFLMSSLTRELTRLDAASATPSQISKYPRRRKDMASVHVLFSHHLDGDIMKQQKKILARLGAHLASSMSDATHFVTDKFVRTRNMLEAIALGKPVVTYVWLESCGQASCFIDEKNYILRDLKKEKEIGFIMPVSLARSCQSPLLQGKRVFITPNVKPGREVVASLVKAAQGLPIERIGRTTIKDDKLPDDLLVLSCEEDYLTCIPLLEKGMEVFSSELILNGIVVQKLEYERHRLFLEHVKRTRSTVWLRCKDRSRFIPVTKCS
ncbi:putative BRCT domain-containing protein [Dioscorea sansibarensis]